jgi:hypothetical protein
LRRLRVHAEGDLRADVTAAEVGVTMLAYVMAVSAFEPVRPGMRHRHLELVLDALASPSRRSPGRGRPHVGLAASAHVGLAASANWDWQQAWDWQRARTRTGSERPSGTGGEREVGPAVSANRDWQRAPIGTRGPPPIHPFNEG